MLNRVRKEGNFSRQIFLQVRITHEPMIFTTEMEFLRQIFHRRHFMSL